MALISLITPESATGTTGEIYQEIARMIGTVPEAMQLFGHNPILMAYMNTRFGYYHGQQQELSAELMRWVLFLNAKRKQCTFCIHYNQAQLLASGVSEHTLASAVADPWTAPLPDRERSMLVFALKTAGDDKSITSDDIEALRRHGYSDTAIFNLVEFTAFATFSDTLLNVFQVEN
ncbi:MAG: hypothetical protein HQM01_09245 [Magnetococcales bacterium]|nr:hypothetical protein [Magnetococcales bacterium]